MFEILNICNFQEILVLHIGSPLFIIHRNIQSSHSNASLHRSRTDFFVRIHMHVYTRAQCGTSLLGPGWYNAFSVVQMRASALVGIHAHIHANVPINSQGWRGLNRNLGPAGLVDSPSEK